MSSDEERWNIFRSHKRVVEERPALTPCMVTALQALKLGLFLVGSVALIVGAAVSKGFVILLATNIKPSKAADPFSSKCGGPSRTRDRVAAIYLALLFIQLIPDVISLIKAILRIRGGRRSGKIHIQLLVAETLRSVGIGLIIFRVLPYLDLSRAGMIFFTLPLIASVQRQMAMMLKASRSSTSFCSRIGRTLLTIPHFLCVLVVVSGAYFWAIMDIDFPAKIALPVGVIAASLGFWESWVHPHHEKTMFHEMFQIKYGMRELNPSTTIVQTFLRGTILTGIMMFTSSGTIGIAQFGHVLTSFSTTYKHSQILMVAIGVCILNGCLRSFCGFLAAMNMRILSVFHPATVSPLILYMTFRSICHGLTCSSVQSIFKIGLGWHCDAWGNPKPFSDFYLCTIWLLIGTYRAWRYVRQRNFGRSDEVIYSMSPSTVGLCIEQSLVVFHHPLAKQVAHLDANDEAVAEDVLVVRNDEVNNSMTMYICATMWHETATEMTQMLRSILKLDDDHMRRQNNKKNYELQFQLEGHIFFDDAWADEEVDGEIRRVPNDFFNLFFELLNEMTGDKADENGRMTSRVLVNTPYGGRLVVRLPAGTLLFVHLKDKTQIRHKKRWSQVMYMYYLLGHRIMDSALSLEDRQQMAEKTFVLAIDGDSKFEPEAVLRLLALMRQKSDIGCACGRIHPIGSGVMVWYQKFEYAIAHWFQKAAEHVFGCVLCAPGCFSLFRASALMDDNIMHKYTKTAEEPRHFVQYDQGEDRWLSTLLLKQGYRIEYVAASDAETYAPEGFEEFFNQRRRWTPSSIANTVDLLTDYKRAVENNSSISMTYIAYQFLVIAFSMLGPAIIFSMVVYAQVAAFGVDSTKMITWNGIPIVTFIILCFVAESNWQLWYAKIMSIVYAFVMLAVLVATTSQVVLETVVSPTSMFVVAMVAIFFFAACLHPREFTNIIYGTVFFLMIPATYVFLSLYSLINLNVINWGTREAVAKATGKVQTESSFDRFVNKMSSGPLAPIVRKFTGKNDPAMVALQKKIEQMEKNMAQLSEQTGDDESLNTDEKEDGDKQTTEQQETEMARSSDKMAWMKTGALAVCERGRLKEAEKEFWKQLIETYLKPEGTTSTAQRAIADGLASLRNHIAFTIILFNALLVLAIFLIQKHKNVLSFKWTPYEGFTWTKMNEENGQFEETEDPLKIDPLGMAIIVFLIGILIVQTIGMIIHRVNTLIGAFQEVSNINDLMSASKKHPEDERIMAAARQMLDTWKPDRGHATDGYTRHTADVAGDEHVLYKLQRGRLAKRIRQGALPE